MHNPETGELVVPIIAQSRFAVGCTVGQGSWRATTNWFWGHSGLWRRVAPVSAVLKTRYFANLDSWSRIPCVARKACVTSTGSLVYTRCEATALLNDLIVPMFNYARWYSQMRSEKCLVVWSTRTLEWEDKARLQNQELFLSTVVTSRIGREQNSKLGCVASYW